MEEQIKLSLPHLAGNENKYVKDAIDSTWITPLGPYVNRFEALLDDYLGVKNVVALSAGTAAIHLALDLLGVGKGDEVICQSMTFSASANPIVYLGATPVFVDSEPDTWNIDPQLLRHAIEQRIKATSRKPKAIVAVYLYGMPAKIDEIMKIAAEFDIPVVEDAAEAIGSEYNGHKCGTIGRFGILSFNGNKMITTSGGGALICPDEESARRALFLATQARENRPYYYHETIGYNYRLSNVSAAIGCAQMEELDWRVNRRRAIHGIYADMLRGNANVMVHSNPGSEFNSNYWLSTILLSDSSPVTADQLRQTLASHNVETRLLWRPMHMQPIYSDAPAYLNGVSERLFDHGLCLPSSTTLSDEQIRHVAELINKYTTV
ncbi:aminotransferase class V-fold PLP-dependent enzyme [Muribaculaceae bacterium Isolate-002 (NCI)]|nr:aminotransferase class V-fold PLP-dependent enzyme [Muribaculaceae bacterium Isolate-002 (NCI)]